MQASEYYDWLAASVGRYEALSKSLIRHKAEKGRVVEGVVKAALRAILPARFSLGTGFIVTASGQTSPQLDVVIYDEFQNAPIILEGGVGVFPIECVYAFVEVKSKLDKRAIASIATAISTVRHFAVEKKYVAYGAGGAPDKPVTVERHIHNDLPPRSYVFALHSTLSTRTIVETMRQRTEETESHIHGLALIKPDFFVAQKAKYEKPYEFQTYAGRAMAHFAGNVLHGVQSFPMLPAAMGPYLGQ